MRLPLTVRITAPELTAEPELSVTESSKDQIPAVSVPVELDRLSPALQENELR